MSEYNFSLFSAAVDTLSSTASSVFNDTVATFALQNIYRGDISIKPRGDSTRGRLHMIAL